MDERKEFERWASDDWTSPNAVLKDADGIYKLMSVQQQWRAWQASAELGTPHATWKLNNLHANYMAVRAECEALRKDAERWKMCVQVSADAMRHPDQREKPELYGSYMKANSMGLNLPACIDAAMGKEKA
jgi:hypothetical protein